MDFPSPPTRSELVNWCCEQYPGSWFILVEGLPGSSSSGLLSTRHHLQLRGQRWYFTNFLLASPRIVPPSTTRIGRRSNVIRFGYSGPVRECSLVV